MAPQQWAQAPAPEPAASGDGYLDRISAESLEILSHFGAEAPIKLNQYAVQVEDALLESLGHQQHQAETIAEQNEYIERVQSVLQAASADRDAMMKILTDPEVLSDYTWKFFSEEGPCPVRTPAEEAQAALRESMEQQAQTGQMVPRARDPQMDAAQQMSPEQQQQMAAAMQRGQFQRPQMNIPSPDGRMAGSRNVFERVSTLMDVRPEDAWKVLSNAPAEDLRRKVFFMEA